MPFLTGRKKAAKAAGTIVDETFFACSHIKKAQADTCDWSENDAQFPGARIDSTCPKCKRPTVEQGSGAAVLVANDDKRAQLEAARQLRAELTGEVYEPLPVPVAVMPVLDASIEEFDVGGQVQVTVNGTVLISVIWDDNDLGPRIMYGNDSPQFVYLRDNLRDEIHKIEWPNGQ